MRSRVSLSTGSRRPFIIVHHVACEGLQCRPYKLSCGRGVLCSCVPKPVAGLCCRTPSRHHQHAQLASSSAAAHRQHRELAQQSRCHHQRFASSSLGSSPAARHQYQQLASSSLSSSLAARRQDQQLTSSAKAPPPGPNSGPPPGPNSGPPPGPNSGHGVLRASRHGGASHSCLPPGRQVPNVGRHLGQGIVR